MSVSVQTGNSRQNQLLQGGCRERRLNGIVLSFSPGCTNINDTNSRGVPSDLMVKVFDCYCEFQKHSFNFFHRVPARLLLNSFSLNLRRMGAPTHEGSTMIESNIGLMLCGRCNHVLTDIVPQPATVWRTKTEQNINKKRLVTVRHQCPITE